MDFLKAIAYLMLAIGYAINALGTIILAAIALYLLLVLF